MEEIWKETPEFNRYKFSCNGEVWDKQKQRNVYEKYYDETGNYGIITLMDNNGEWVTLRLHRLIAKIFIPNPDNLPCVNHRDENKHNNSVENLEWCTHDYNNNYGTHNERVGDSNRNGKLSKQVAQYSLDGNLIKIWPSTMEIRRQLGFSQGNIASYCRGERKTAYGFIWKYLD